jgi:hypothetical protein
MKTLKKKILTVLTLSSLVLLTAVKGQEWVKAKDDKCPDGYHEATYRDSKGSKTGGNVDVGGKIGGAGISGGGNHERNSNREIEGRGCRKNEGAGFSDKPDSQKSSGGNKSTESKQSAGNTSKGSKSSGGKTGGGRCGTSKDCGNKGGGGSKSGGDRSSGGGRSREVGNRR